jgi:hypothetical protein
MQLLTMFHVHAWFLALAVKIDTLTFMLPLPGYLPLPMVEVLCLANGDSEPLSLLLSHCPVSSFAFSASSIGGAVESSCWMQISCHISASTDCASFRSGIDQEME